MLEKKIAKIYVHKDGKYCAPTIHTSVKFARSRPFSDCAKSTNKRLLAVYKLVQMYDFYGASSGSVDGFSLTGLP